MITNKPINVQKFVWGLAVVIGIVFLFRELLFWSHYDAFKNNVLNINGQVSDFQKKFLERTDNMNNKAEEMKNRFAKRQQAFSQRFTANRNVETKEKPQNENKPNVEVSLSHLIEMLKYDLSDENKNEPIEKKCQLLPAKAGSLN